MGVRVSPFGTTGSGSGESKGGQCDGRTSRNGPEDHSKAPSQRESFRRQDILQMLRGGKGYSNSELRVFCRGNADRLGPNKPE